MICCRRFSCGRCARKTGLYFLLAYYGFEMSRVKILDGGAVE